MPSYENFSEYDPSLNISSYIELRGEATEFIGAIDTSIRPEEAEDILTITAGSTRYDVVQYPGEDLIYLYVPAENDELPILYPIAKGDSQHIGRSASVGNSNDTTQSRLHCEVEYGKDGLLHIRNHSAVNSTGISLKNVTQVDIGISIEQDTESIPVIQEKAPGIRCQAAGFSMVPEGYRPNRSGSDDRMLVDNAQRVYGVFDGIGSRPQAGLSAEFIAKTVSKTLKENHLTESWLSPTEQLIVALECANRNMVTELALTDLALTDTDRQMVRDIIADGPDAIIANRKHIDSIVLSQVGSTACIAHVTERYDGTPIVAWASVGDSRLYLVRDKKMIQLSIDEGEGNGIYNWVGMAEEKFGVQRYGEEVCYSGDTFVLVTDGVTGDYPEQEIPEKEFISAATNPNVDSAAWKLTRIAKKADDRTAVVIRIE